LRLGISLQRNPVSRMGPIGRGFVLIVFLALKSFGTWLVKQSELHGCCSVVIFLRNKTLPFLANNHIGFFRMFFIDFPISLWALARGASNRWSGVVRGTKVVGRSGAGRLGRRFAAPPPFNLNVPVGRDWGEDDYSVYY
jgi:hypothetical protein